MYGTDRGRSGLQRNDENDALVEELILFQPVPIRETVDRDAVYARDLKEGVPTVHLVARGPFPDVLRRSGGFRQDEVRSALEGLRRGQQMLTKYRIDDDPAGYMDTKA